MEDETDQHPAAYMGYNCDQQSARVLIDVIFSHVRPEHLQEVDAAIRQTIDDLRDRMEAITTPRRH